jgi:predicted RNA-binding protein with TRAM domain
MSNPLDLSSPQVGDVIEEVEIVGHGSKGDPIGKISGGLVVIIKGNLNVGDVVDIEITGVKERCCFADVKR